MSIKYVRECQMKHSRFLIYSAVKLVNAMLINLGYKFLKIRSQILKLICPLLKLALFHCNYKPRMCLVIILLVKARVRKKSPAVFKELRERESSHCNLVVHNLAEPGQGVVNNQESVTEDKSKLHELFGIIDVELSVDDITHCVKRLGPVNAESSTSLFLDDRF